MDRKTEITKKVLAILNPNYSPKDLKIAQRSWWVSQRKKDKGGLRLTTQGYESFRDAGIKPHKLEIEEISLITNQLIIWFDRFIDCPFYIKGKRIILYESYIAVQLILFSGNLEKFVVAKARSLKSA